MASKLINKRIPDGQKLIVEKELIERYYPNFHCNSIDHKTHILTCIGQIQPTEHSVSYKLKMVYPVWGKPRMYIVEPVIKPSLDIHIYKEGHLCLYHPIETPWKDTHHLKDTIIPWTAEWLVFYELYRINGGKWLGKSYPHGATDKN